MKITETIRHYVLNSSKMRAAAAALLPLLLLGYWYIAAYAHQGMIPFIPDDWAFPYDLSRLSVSEIIGYFNRQPPGYLLYVKLLHTLTRHLPLSVFQAISLCNLAMFAGMLLILYAFIAAWTNRRTACGITCFVALGSEFHIYILFTRYTMATAFWLFALIYCHARAFGDLFPTRRRYGWMAAALIAALSLVMTRSFYIYLGAVYLPFFALSVYRVHGWRSPRLVSMIPVLASAAVAVAVPVSLMTKNKIIYGQFTLSSWIYESHQKNIHRQIRAGTIKLNTKKFIEQSDAIPASTKALFAAGLPWPVTRGRVHNIMTKKKGSKLHQEIQRRFPPKQWIAAGKDPDSHLYFHRASGNGHLVASLLEQGSRVSSALFSAHWSALVTGIMRDGGPRAICHSLYFFADRYGEAYCRAPASLSRNWRRPLPVVSDLKVPFLQAADAHVKAHPTIVPIQISALHLILHNALFRFTVLIGALHLLYALWAFIRRRELDPVTTLVSGVVVYSFLAGVYGDYLEAARFSLYWKLPSLCLLVWTGALLVRSLLRNSRGRRTQGDGGC